MPREGSNFLSAGSLARLGFQETDVAAARLSELGPPASPVVAILGRTADPDLALDALVRLHAAAADGDVLIQALEEDEGTAMRLLSVLGMSAALGEHLVRHPEHWHELTDPTLGSTRPAAYAVRAGLVAAVGADPLAARPVSGSDYASAVDALRVEYRRVLLRLASRDLAHHVGMDDIAAELSDLAAGTLDAALAIARAKVGDEAAGCRLAVIAMGKCGGHELNYVSDVDVIFVAEPADGVEESAALRVATHLASTLIQVCGDHTAEGTIWPVDANLRPEGKSGPLVRTLASHRGYYERWAKTWEFQALLKARPVAGDLELGREYVEIVGPMVWQAAERDGFVDDVQAMRRRVLEHIPANEAKRQLKLGSGGLRDVEFAVQLLQLVHGRTDDKVRQPTTLSALSSLTAGGYIGREDGRTMHEAYAFLRTFEHRIQLFQLRRTHVVPEAEAALRRLGRSLGHLRNPVLELEKEWRHHRREARRLHEKLFYRPLLAAVARIPGDGARLTTEAAKERLAALGYTDPDAALRHLEALTSGVSRTAAIQRTLLPVLLEWFADAPDPDAGLFGFRRISDTLGSTPWYLTMLRDEGETAQRLAQVLATSRYATDLLEREPEGVKILGGEDSLRPLTRDALQTEMLANASRRGDPVEAIRSIRAIRRRELLRISAADLCVPFGVAEVGYALTDLTDATLEASLRIAIEAVEAERGRPLPTRFAIIAMGRYGGYEMGYGSDADVMFVHDPHPGADAHEASSMAQAVVNELRRLLALPATDPPLEIDADLRPEGKQGAMVRTLEAYAAYYAKWSAVWEAQALLRAEPVCGDEDLKDRFRELIDPLRFPAAGLGEDDLVEIRRIKARIEDERMPRGADPATHFKLGRGGLADVEWTIQVLQLQHAGAVPELRTTKTLPALDAAVAHDLIAAEDAEILRDAWLLASRARNAAVLVRGKPSDQLPTDPRERAAVAKVLGYGQGESTAMVNDYQRTTRRALGVVDRVFWGS
ncbi:bifunctional [glutamine synthetase] adenylyltransferase/[glutamine synthetase]-adenylyl-L-tyrosine phosphorylase [Nocardioides marmoriginsengisoli]|uniref:Bifunctional glutamine synthetase adenylyltransferase/adenylyl-removing enzyme n=1 Tax=Nocardioides marmoriginsengisoli TaxID=661483 RepID=A0A3N0CLJ7_9ACTN|nr:bifunctional [glutamine synthetase] adenylyltransferase/[glutamine synthetase]-adenylyl-L-tyrosine phosphorylase [Nocardioides marmoriginsengisoli]RNL64328.1 bifunctional [glutamine synthetase] adenylyltransferase/[glutamine synthetase]-adenylyl-L-tyrosine phosphorylase [Nocardioides marmoriginsengisoli]